MVGLGLKLRNKFVKATFIMVLLRQEELSKFLFIFLDKLAYLNMCLVTCYQFLNDIIKNFTHFFTNTYF